MGHGNGDILMAINIDFTEDNQHLRDASTYLFEAINHAIGARESVTTEGINAMKRMLRTDLHNFSVSIQKLIGVKVLKAELEKLSTKEAKP